MSTRISKIELDDLNKAFERIKIKDIEKRIEIVYKTIQKYKSFINLGLSSESGLKEIKLKLEREEKALDKLKDEYPEYFI